MVSWSDVTDLDPSLATVAVATQNAILADAVLLLSPTAFGDRYDLAVKYFAAHSGALIVRGGSATVGVVVSESLGSASRSYASPPTASSNFAEFGSTIWGQRFLFLLRTIVTMDVI